MHKEIAVLVKCLPKKIKTKAGTYYIDVKRDKLKFINEYGLIMICDLFFNATQSNKVYKTLQELQIELNKTKKGENNE